MLEPMLSQEAVAGALGIQMAIYNEVLTWNEIVMIRLIGYGSCRSE